MKSSKVPEKRPNLAALVRTRIARVLLSAVSAGLMAGVAPVQAKDISSDSMMPEDPGKEVTLLLDYFPAGSIDSVERADEALDLIEIEKGNIDARLYNEKLLCNKKFFVTWCYEEAEHRKAVDSQALHLLEVEARRFKRSDDVQQRDLAIDESTAKDEANAPQCAENVAAHEARVKRVEERMAREAAAARGVSQSGSHDGNLMTPAEKAENVRKYNDKKAQVTKNQSRVEKKKAQTQAKREQKANSRK